MGKTRTKHREWFREFLRPRFPELVVPLQRAMDAFDEIMETKQVQPELLAIIVEAASSPRRPMYENTTTLLGKLTEHYSEARDAVMAMSRDTRNHVRFNAILCLEKETPSRLTLDVLRRGLLDPSAKVRAKAADWAGRLRLRKLVPEMELAESKEKDKKTRESITFELQLLRDGYILKRKGKTGFYITTFMNEGGITSSWISAKEMKERGIKKIVAELAKDLF